MQTAILLSICLPLYFNATGQISNYQSEATQLKNFLLKYHIEPRNIDDKFSNEVFNSILNELDPEKLIFTTEDIVWLSQFKNSIDDEINGKNWSFLSRLKERYDANLQRAEFLTSDILHTPIEWNINESIELSPQTWPKDENALRNRFRRVLKLKVLQKIFWMMQVDSTEEALATRMYSNDASVLVRKLELRKISHIKNYPSGLDAYLGNLFLKTITSIFDPHSAYFSSVEFENFKRSLNTEGYYFGFTLDDTDDGLITITSLTPGGPAWKSGVIQVSDVITVIKPSSGDPIELEGLSIEEVNSMLDNVSDKTLEFTVRKPDGTQQTVSLKKEKIHTEENLVRSFILQGEIKAGYIRLPDFYMQWGEADGGSRSADDVAREIIKLKKDSINGLILDVRYNGGGSLEEALSMAGIFIDQGALGFMRDKQGVITVLKDPNKGTIYDGPLIIMVNGYSASASEILAGALQDYNRALIVGSKTFGKSTGQNILPLNTTHTPELAFQKNEAFVKVTTERLYRVTGRSAQLAGVTPDVEFPEVFSLVAHREDSNPFALKADSLNKSTSFKILPPLPVSSIKEKSIERLLGNESFQKLITAYQTLTEFDNRKIISLRWSDFLKDEIEKNRNRSAIEEVQQHRSSFTVKIVLQTIQDYRSMTTHQNTTRYGYITWRTTFTWQKQ
jgi:carboxyl-terminal processing protease